MGSIADRSSAAQALAFTLAGSSWLFHLKPRAISLVIDKDEIITFDREGRPYAAFLDGRNYRRGLDGRVLEKYRKSGGGRQRRFLKRGERRQWLERIRERVEQLAQGFWSFATAPDEATLKDLGEWTKRLSRWNGAALEADQQRFHEVYRAVSILPPDQYMALVVQTSEGCPWNRCTFCDLYRDRSYRVKTPEELQEHLKAIRDFLGEGIRLRRSIFLGDANLLATPQERLLQAFAQVRNALAGSGGPERQLFGFTDAPGVQRHPGAELHALRQAGLERLYLGLETGSEALLRLLDKPGSAQEAVAAVHRLRQAGIGAGIIVLLGLGGRLHAGEHEAETVRTLEAMELGRSDILYFSPLIEHAHGVYARQAGELRFGRLDNQEMDAQRQRLEQALRFGAERPLLSTYDIRDFIY